MIRTPAQTKMARSSRGNAALALSLGLPLLSFLVPRGDAFAQTQPPPAQPVPPPGPVAPPAAVPAPPPATAAPPAAVAPPPPGAPPYYQPGAPPPPAAPPPVYAQPAPQPYPQPYPQPPGQPYGVYAPAPTVLPDVLEDEGQPVPAGYRRERRPRGGLVIAGIGVFAPLYAFSLTAALGSDDTRDRWLALPVFGPIVDMLQRKSCSSSTSYCPDSEGARTILAMDFVGQATGVLLFSLGYGIPREVFVRGEHPPDRSGRALPILLVPGMIGGASGAPGLSAAGAF